MTVTLTLRWEDDDEATADFCAMTFLRLWAWSREAGYLSDYDGDWLSGLVNAADLSLGTDVPSAEAATTELGRMFELSPQTVARALTILNPKWSSAEVAGEVQRLRAERTAASSPQQEDM